MRILAQIPGIFAAAVVCLTVCALPWMLGGVIPLARVILVAGAVVAGLISLFGYALSGRFPASLPLIIFPLIGLIMLGTWQLRPVEGDPVESVNHAVSEPTVADLPMPAKTASMSAADTRTVIATLLAVAIMGIVCFDHVRTKRTIACFGAVVLLNGLVLTVVGVTGVFQDRELEINALWSLGTKSPFATFVNPNNAAGWICLSFSVAVGWLAYYVRSATDGDQDGVSSLRIPLTARVWTYVLQFLAELTVWKLFAFAAFVFFAVGVAVTKSRGGMLALVLGLVLTGLLASSLKRLPLMIGILCICGSSIYGMLNWLDLDSGVTAEIRTLRDLDDAAGSRPRHWWDSLQSLRDFPLAGAGLGAYRFATLPYQTQHTGLWYRFADNNFVDVAVEGGILGFLLFVAVGICGVVTGLAGWRQCRSPKSGHIGRETLSSERTGPLVWAVGTTAIVAALTQAVSGFFDYGVSMPAAASMLIVLISIAAGCLHESESTSDVRRTGAVQGGRMVVFSVHLCLISSAAAYFVDQKAAADIDLSVVTGTQLLSNPVTTEALDNVAAERQLLEQRLRRRPDDPEGLIMLSKLADADFRWRVIRREYGSDVRKQSGFGFLWQRSTALTLAQQVSVLSARNPIAAVQKRSRIRHQLNASALVDVFSRVQRRFPLMPNIAERRAELAVLLGDNESFKRQMAHAVFVEPSNAETRYRLGLLAMFDGKKEVAEELWQRSTQLAASFRGAILLNARQAWAHDEVMQLFGPTSYVECVVAAQECHDLPLKTTLLNRGEGLWTDELAPQDDDDIAALRAWQLTSEKRYDDAAAWLKERVRLPGEHISLRRLLARLLHRLEQYDDAAAEWHTILYLAPDDSEATAALKKLRDIRQSVLSTGE